MPIASQPNKTSSLQNRLLSWLLIITLVPLVIVSWSSYQQSKKSLVKAATISLKQSSLTTKNFITNWFEYRFTDVTAFAKIQSNQKKLLEISQGWQKSNLSLSEYINSPDWHKIKSSTNDNLLTIREQYDYIHDLFLIDPVGNILLNLSNEPDLGTNILTGTYSNTLFSNTVKNTLKTGKTLFSGLESYEPSNNLLSGFIISPMINSDGNPLGLLAIQIKLDRIYQLMDSDYSNSIIHYIIDEQARLQTPIHGSWLVDFNKRIDTNAIINAQSNIQGVSTNTAFPAKVSPYTGIENIEVLGITQNVNVGNINWQLISEVHYDEALSEVHWLAQLIILIFIATALITICIAIFLARKITKPIKNLAKASLKVASGEAIHQIDQVANDEIGQLTHAFNFMVKTQQQQQSELTENANQLSLIIDNTGVGIWDWDILSGNVVCSQHWYDILGYEKGELDPFTVDKWASLLHPDEIAQVMMIMDEHLSGEKDNYACELRIKHKLGHWVWLHDSGKLVEHTVDGAPKRIIGTIIDIGERKESELKLAKSEAFARGMFNSAADGIISIDTRGAIQAFNPAAERMYGFSQEELHGKHISEIIPPALRQQYLEGFNYYLDTKRPKILNRPLEVEGFRRDGTTFELELTVSQVNIGDEQYFTAMSRDISLRKKHEKQLQKLHQITEIKLLISNALTQARSLSTKLSSAIEQLFELDDLQQQKSGGVLLVDGSTQQLSLYSSVGDLSKQYNQEGAVCNNEPYLKSAESGEIVIKTINQESLDAKAKDYGQYIVPLINHTQSSDTVIGVLFIYTEKEPDTSTERITLLKQVGEMFSTCIIQENARTMLKEASKSAEHNSQLKSEFLASMSHEIRTPMNGVLGMLGLLLNSELTTDQLHKANLAKSSAESLLTLINDILDFSKVEAGKMELEYCDFNLRGMLGEFTEAMALKAQSKGLEVILDITQVEQSFVKGDQGRIRQILTNLVGNAIKFTQQGEIIIRVATHAIDQETLTLHCLIEDTGIGIPSDKIEGLFEKFSQIDASTTRKYGGTGLGLSISKKLCQLMDGTISAKSIEGKGSTFEFTIVIKTSQQSEKVMPSIDIGLLDLLIVDDNLTNREVLRGQLEHWGAKVTEATNAKEAIAICEQRLMPSAKLPLFDVAFLDMQMPEMDGAQLGKYFRANSQFNKMKMVMMTSISHGNDSEFFTAIGFDAFFPKPATTSDLMDALAIVVDSKEEYDSSNKSSSPLVTHNYLQSFTKSNAPSPTKINAKHTNEWPTDTHILIVEDNRINQLVALGILDKIGLAADVSNNGIEAIKALLSTNKDNLYTLILMDCQMPEMDGYQASQKIRQGDAGLHYKNIPIIAMTANAMRGDREKCLAHGMSDYLSKPIEPELLTEKMNNWLHSPELTTEYITTENKTTPPQDDVPVITDEVNQEDIPHWNLKACLHRVRNNEQLLKMLIETFIKDMPEHMDALNKVIIKKDYSQIHYYAHTIKGMAGNLSALKLSDHSHLLELSVKSKSDDEITHLNSLIVSDYNELLEIFSKYLNTL